jgi:hypothetical protein
MYCTYKTLIMINLEECWKKYYMHIFFFLYIFRGFCVYVPLPPLRGQHTVLCHPRWLPTSGRTEFAMSLGGAGFEPRTIDLQSGALPYAYIYILLEGSKILIEPTVQWAQ